MKTRRTIKGTSEGGIVEEVYTPSNPPPYPVRSVAGKTDEVTLTKSDVGLGNVDNTSDDDKPISTATQNALNGKANTSGTYPNLNVGKATNADNVTGKINGKNISDIFEWDGTTVKEAANARKAANVEYVRNSGTDTPGDYCSDDPWLIYEVVVIGTDSAANPSTDYRLAFTVASKDSFRTARGFTSGLDLKTILILSTRGLIRRNSTACMVLKVRSFNDRGVMVDYVNYANWAATPDTVGLYIDSASYFNCEVRERFPNSGPSFDFAIMPLGYYPKN